jgi:hypothetical protein
MKERPILFNSEMVRAILDGRKTMTRRVIKFPERAYTPDLSWIASVNPDGAGGWVAWGPMPVSDEFSINAYPDGGGIKCPYGQPGDLLWVRETWAHKSEWTKPAYKADWKTPDHAIKTMGAKWKPSIHMPRWASRITLRVLDVRVERVQEITEADAHHEGWFYQNHPLDKRYDPVTMDTARQWFLGLWDSINAKRGYPWDSNPWVWVVSFEVVK